MKTIMTAVWAAVLFVTSLPASAAQPDLDTRSARVDYSDLDLNVPHGVSTLQHRVTGAIRQVCDEPASSLQERMQQRACARNAATAAHRDVENAITAARQRPATTSAGPAAASASEKTSSALRQQPWSRQNPIRKH